MNDGPLVSAIIPAWNAEATLQETLESVGTQTYENLEILIVDDGSTDRTCEIAEAYCAMDPRARLIRKANGGVASARNAAIDVARGEWIAPVDADDLWHPTKIAKQLAVTFEQPERPGFVYCWYQYIDVSGRVLASGPQRQFTGRALKQFAFNNPVGNGSALLILREAAQAVGGYDPGLRDAGAEGCEDVQIQFQLARRLPVAVVPEFLVGYRKYPGSMSSNMRQIVRSWNLVYDRLVVESPDIPDRVVRWNASFFNILLAEDAAVRRQFGSALGHLAIGLWLDPPRWSAYIFYRLCRTARRLVFGRRPARKPIHFRDADPTVAISGDPDALPRLAKLYDILDRSRLRSLERTP